MFPVEIADKFPVSSLFPDRYGLGKTKIYEHMRTLNIKPFKVGKHAFIKLEQLQALDRYIQLLETDPVEATVYANEYSENTYLKEILEHVPDHLYPEEEEENSPPLKTSYGLLERNHEQVRGLVHSDPFSAFVKLVTPYLKATDPLAPQAFLSRASREGWAVTTSQLKEVGIKAQTDTLLYQRWVLKRSGKQGREMLWFVQEVKI